MFLKYITKIVGIRITGLLSNTVGFLIGIPKEPSGMFHPHPRQAGNKALPGFPLKKCRKIGRRKVQMGTNRLYT